MTNLTKIADTKSNHWYKTDVTKVSFEVCITLLIINVISCYYFSISHGEENMAFK